VCGVERGIQGSGLASEGCMRGIGKVKTNFNDMRRLGVCS